MERYHKILKLGKIDYNGNGKKSNEVEIELCLEEAFPGLEGKLRFSAMGQIWDSRHTDIVMGGQCIDKIAEMFPTDKVKRICEIWKRWHLNDMHAGCEHQREFEKEPYEKHAGCHCDICDYTYGTAWNFEAIPQEIIDEIKSF